MNQAPVVQYARSSQAAHGSGALTGADEASGVRLSGLRPSDDDSYQEDDAVKIELRKVRYAKWASQETACYSATVLVDGVEAGTASNDGGGGADHVRPYELQLKLEAYAKTLPRRAWPASLGGGDYQPSYESLLGDLLQAHLLRKDFDRAVGKRVLFIDGGKLMQTNTLPAAELTRALDVLYADRITLNRMPAEEAFALYLRLAKPATFA